MFNCTISKSNLRTIRQGDSEWLLRDGYVTTPRAVFEIDQKCPNEYKHIILNCIQRGWLKPVANVKDHELFWEELKR